MKTLIEVTILIVLCFILALGQYWITHIPGRMMIIPILIWVGIIYSIVKSFSKVSKN